VTCRDGTKKVAIKVTAVVIIPIDWVLLVKFGKRNENGRLAVESNWKLSNRCQCWLGINAEPQRNRKIVMLR
jgi:hypothetical protein